MNYPDFTHQISQLKSSYQQSDDEQKQRLLKKWLEQLEVINEEIRHLEKIERFALKVKKD